MNLLHADRSLLVLTLCGLTADYYFSVTEDGGATFLRNGAIYPEDYTALEPLKKSQQTSSPPQEPHI
jgi:hypothetical protein